MIYLEGNIGAGKTTLLNRLKLRYDSDKCLLATEPVSNWPSLKLFYEDKKRYTYQLQLEIMESFHVRETDCPIRECYIFERSIRSSLEVFATLNCSAEELQRLIEKSLTMGRIRQHPFITTVYIYIRTPVQKCLDNIAKRNNIEELSIDRLYLEKLECLHDNIFTETASLTNANKTIYNNSEQHQSVSSEMVFIIDGDQSEEDLTAATIEIIEKILRTRF